jgi:hypothetical protein
MSNECIICGKIPQGPTLSCACGHRVCGVCFRAYSQEYIMKKLDELHNNEKKI